MSFIVVQAHPHSLYAGFTRARLQGLPMLDDDLQQLHQRLQNDAPEQRYSVAITHATSGKTIAQRQAQKTAHAVYTRPPPDTRGIKIKETLLVDGEPCVDAGPILHTLGTEYALAVAALGMALSRAPASVSHRLESSLDFYAAHIGLRPHNRLHVQGLRADAARLLRVEPGQSFLPHHAQAIFDDLPRLLTDARHRRRTFRRMGAAP